MIVRMKNVFVAPKASVLRQETTSSRSETTIHLRIQGMICNF